MAAVLFRHALIAGSERIIRGDLLTDGPYIAKIAPEISAPQAQEIDCRGLTILPGIIDSHVHFREPGLTRKATIRSESRAAVLGGVTTCLDMPNTDPPTTTLDRLAAKEAIAGRDSVVNYAAYLGAAPDNLEEIKRVPVGRVPAIKIYMGSTTGNLLTSDPKILEQICAASPIMVATHCEDDGIIRENLARARENYPDGIPLALHPFIRSRAACLKSTRLAIAVALSTNTPLQILHISTAEELGFLTPFREEPLKTRRVSGEACVPHLCFSDGDYLRKGGALKCNPSVKTERDRLALSRAVASGLISAVSTDHAPHELAAKEASDYEHCASGCSSVQFSLPAMLNLVRRGEITLEDLIHVMAAWPAGRYGIEKRGSLQEGNFADLCVVNLHAPHVITASEHQGAGAPGPFIGERVGARVLHTMVSGVLKVRDGALCSDEPGLPLRFDHGL